MNSEIERIRQFRPNKTPFSGERERRRCGSQRQHRTARRPTNQRAERSPGAQGQLSETHFTTRSYDDRHVRRRRRQRRRRRRRRPFPTIQTLLPSRSNTVTVARAAFRSHASHALGSTPSPRTARTRPLHRPHGYIHASRESVNSRPIAMAEEYLYGKYERP